MGYPNEQSSIEEVKAWDILVNYLVVKHSAIESSIKRYVYVDIEKNGSSFSISDQPNEKALLLCRKNKNDLVGSVIYRESINRNEDFNLKKILDFFKEQNTPLENSKYNEDEAEDYLSITPTFGNRIIGALMAYIYGYEYEFSKGKTEYIHHANQVFKKNDQLGLLKYKNTSNIKDFETITVHQTNTHELITFIKNDQHIANAFQVEKDEVLSIVESEDFSVEDYLSNNAKEYGFTLFPLHDLNGNRISTFGYATKQDESENQLLMVRNKSVIVGTLQFNKECKEDNLYIVSYDIANSDALAKIIPNHKIHCTLTAKNTINFIENALNHNKDAVIAIAVENIYEKAIKHTMPNEVDTSIEESTFSNIINHLIKRPHLSNAIVFVMPKLDSNDQSETIDDSDPDFLNFDFNEYMANFGKKETKKAFITALNSAIERRVNNHQELDFIISEYIDQKIKLKQNHQIDLPNIFNIKETDESIESTKHKNEPYIQVNPIIIEGYKMDYKALFEDTSMDHLTEKEKAFYEQQANFNAQISNLDDSEFPSKIEE